MAANEYHAIDCADYDHLEVACMESYELEVVLSDKTLRGCAVTTETNREGEFLHLRVDNDSITKIRADRIWRITVLSNPRRFDERVFRDVEGGA